MASGLVRVALAFLVLSFALLALYRNICWVSIVPAAFGAAIVFSLSSPLLLFVGWEIVSWTIFFSIILRGSSGGTESVPVVASRKNVVYLYVSFAALSAVFMLMWIFLSHFSYKSPYFYLAVVASVIKGAIIPFHLWLVPVYSSMDLSFTAFNSAVLSKLGLIVILLPLYLGADYSGVRNAVESFGLEVNFIRIFILLSSFTALYAAYRAVLTEDLVELLSYSSLSQVGYIFAGAFLSLSSGKDVASMALNGTMLHALNHALVKIPFFMLAYFVERKYGTTSLSETGGLYKKSPVLFFLVLPLAISLAGVPPAGGFVSKWLLYTSMLRAGYYVSFFLLGVAGVLSFLYVYRFLHSLFFERLKKDSLKEDDFLELKWHFLPTGVASVMTLIVGVKPSLVTNLLSSAIPEPLSLNVEAHLPTGSIAFAFLLLVIFSAFLWKISADHRYVPDTDNYTSAAVRLDQNPEISYDFSYGFYMPLKRPFRWLCYLNPEKLYDVLWEYLRDGLSYLRTLASGRFTDYIFYISIFAFVMLFVGKVFNTPCFLMIRKIFSFVGGG